MPDPMYRQIAGDLRQKIKSGVLSPGAQLPTELALREQYNNASRNTVRDAVKWLISRGLVETRPGQGTFVVEKIDPFVTVLDLVSGFGGEAGTTAYESEVTARSRKPTVTAPRIEIHPAAVASELQLGEGSSVVSRHQPRYIDGTPFSLQTTFYPMSYVETGASDLIKAVDMPAGVVLYLAEKLGIKQAGWRDKITVRAPDADEAAFFRLPDDGRVAVFEIRRTAFDESGKPLRLTVTAYPADRNHFVFTSGDVPPEIMEPSQASITRANSTEHGDTS
jgi:GntR family transcriptional regulator